METPFYGDGGVGALPGSQLWGRPVQDLAGRRIGTIDSVVRSSTGPVEAIILTAGRPRRFVFVDLRGAGLDGEAVVVSLLATSDLVARPEPLQDSAWRRIRARFRGGKVAGPSGGLRV